MHATLRCYILPWLDPSYSQTLAVVIVLYIFLEDALVEALKVVFAHQHGDNSHAQGPSLCIRNALGAGGGPGTLQGKDALWLA